MMRGRLLCADTLPNCALPKTVLGGANCAVLVMLKNSARNCSLSFSVSFVFLCSDMSSSLVVSERRPLSVRLMLPKVNGAGLENWVASIQRSGVGLETAGLTPVQFGRWPPPWEKVLLADDTMPRGPPLNSDKMAPISHPPRILPGAPCMFLAIGSS